MDPLGKKWVLYYIVTINPECWVLYKARRPIDRIQPYLITNMSINSHRALACLLGIEVALWNQN